MTQGHTSSPIHECPRVLLDCNSLSVSAASVCRLKRNTLVVYMAEINLRIVFLSHVGYSGSSDPTPQ
jgi:hypothetical protein